MSNDDDREGFEHRQGFRSEPEHRPIQRGRAPGKGATTERAPGASPAAAILGRIQEAEALLNEVGARLPAMEAAIAARSIQEARVAGGELTSALTRLDRALAAARRWATITGSDGTLALLAPLEAARDARRADAAPVLALAPPPGPRVSDAALFDPLGAEWDAAILEEQANDEGWRATLDASEATIAQPAPDNVIDASDRFGRASEPVQRRAAGYPAEQVDLPQVAASGVADGGSALPHRETIQRSFGAHDVSGVQAHVGGRAADAASAIGAEAYATGNHVAFAEAPSLFVAAHEAAHVVQQRAGVSLLGGVGVAGDSYEQHADAVADAVVRGESAEGLLGPVGRDGGATAVQRREGKATGRLAEMTSSVDFGDVPVGLPTTREIHVFNQQPTALQIDRPTLLNDLGEYRVAAPTVAVAKSDDPSYVKSVLAEPIRVTFTPTRPGCFDNLVGFNLTDGTRSEWCAVQLYAHARAVGAASSGDHAEREARRETQEQEEKDAEGSAARLEELAAKGKAVELDDQVERELLAALRSATNRSNTFIERQKDGINIEARTEIEHYERRIPTVSGSTLATIAELALVAAAAAISQGMVPMFEAAFAAKTLSRFEIWPGHTEWETTQSDGKAGARIASGMVREVLKGLARHFVGSIFASSVESNDPAVSTDAGASHNPIAAFLSGQAAALELERTRRQDELESVHDALCAVAATAPAAAVAALEAHALLLEMHTEAARLRQIDETRLAWIRAVARGSLGAKGADAPTACDPKADQTVTDLDGLAQAPTERDRPDAVDGLLELIFDADLARPDLPAKATSAKLTGVSQEIATQLERMDLNAASLPIRAVGRPAGTTVAVIPIAITQDEAGAISVDGGVDYLSSKADPTRGGVDAGTIPDAAQVALAHEGARIVMTELTARPLQDQQILVESDDGTGHR